MKNRTYTTRTDAIYYEIVKPIEDAGEIADAYESFNIDAIADEVIEHKNGYSLAEHITPDDFWDIVLDNARV